MVARPRSWPSLAHGDGGWSYDTARHKIELRHVVDGKRYVERGETTDECIAKRNRRRREIETTAQLHDGGSATIAELLDAWIDYESQGKAGKTINCYLWTTGHVKRHLGDLPATDLDIAQLETMYAAVVNGGRGFSGSSMIKIRSHLTMAVDFGIRRKYLPDNYALIVHRSKTPAGAARARAKRWFDLVEYDLIRAELVRIAPSFPPAAALFTMLLCGLRPAEALGLRWQYVDLEVGMLSVEEVIKREPSHAWTPSTTLKTDHKHDHAHREVPMTDDLRLVLRSIRKRGEASDWVFSTGGTFLHFDVLARTAQRLAIDVGVKYVNPNGYRHTFASVCRHAGMPYEMLAKLMGHKDASMIIATYGHPVVPTTTVDMNRYLGNGEF